MRQFTLRNEYGQEYALNDIRTGFLQSPTGLGYSLEYSYQKLGASWVQNYLRDSQTAIGGTVVFATTSPYEAQQDFLQFVRTSKKIILVYTTPAHSRYKDVDIVAYDISEIGEGNTLQCPITMMPKSLWYSATTEQSKVTSGDGIRYSYRWPARFNDFANGYKDITNDGSVPAAFAVEFSGAITNPEISLLVDGVETAKVEITGSVSSGSKIIYQSKDGAGETYCYSGTNAQIEAFKQTGVPTGLTNLALSFDIDNANFFKLPIGTSRIALTADTAMTNPIMISVYKYYRAV